jgi:hypothetical protein
MILTAIDQYVQEVHKNKIPELLLRSYFSLSKFK